MQAEARRLHEVELHRAQRLLRAAEGAYLNVDLRAVERGVADTGLMVGPPRDENVAQQILGPLPSTLAVDVLAARVARVA